MRHPTFHIFGFTPETLRAWCAERGMASYRADQILDWVYGKGVVDPGAMSNLARTDRETLGREMVFLSGRDVAHRRATDGVQKLLIQWEDAAGAGHTDEADNEPEAHARDTGAGHSLNVLGNTDMADDPTRQTECVMIPVDDEDRSRRTACISSQVGCPVGCRFCASGLGGLDGNLSAGRIVEQVWRLNRLVARLSEPCVDHQTKDTARRAVPPGRISNIVFMGMGEPLANFGPVKQAVETLAAPWGMGISARKITISTVGLPKAIERLAAQLDLPVTLALSLHAPNDELRRRLIPWSSYTTIDELLGACDAWFRKTGREITLEYILLGGVNDRPEHAEQLAALAKRFRGNVNLIRYNEVRGLEFRRPMTEDVRRFQEILRERGVNAHIRASRGRDIEAACGQLRHETAGAGGASDASRV